MPVRRLLNSLIETVLRITVIGAIVGGAWLVLQVYSEDEIAAAGQEFWHWWSSLLGGDLAQYWNPVGAALALITGALIVLNPLMRFLRGGRQGRGYHHNDDYGGTDDSFDADDGGDDND